MKNILSSLNESEKRRILEMHYNATNRQYLTENPPVQKTTTTAAQLIQLKDKYIEKAGSDLFNYSYSQDSNQKSASVDISKIPSAGDKFVNAGTLNLSGSYNCKTGWTFGKNPFETNITLQYKNDPTLPPPIYSHEKNISIATAAQNIVNTLCQLVTVK